MFSKPENGWTEVEVFGKYIGAASNTWDVPFDTAAALLRLLNGEPLDLAFDAEGSWFDLATICGRLYIWSDIGGDNARIEQLATDLPSAAIAKQLVQECIADLATYLDGWAIWMGDTEQDAEDRKQMLVQKITELSETLEKLEHRTPALSP